MSKQEEEARIHLMSDEELSRQLLHAIWRLQDAGGVSHGRSWENKLLEAAMALVDEKHPSRKELCFNDDILLAEAEARNRAASEKRMAEHFAELDRCTRPK